VRSSFLTRLLLLSPPAAVACTLASALPARAAELPLLVVHRTEDAVACPDARALAALVAEQMQRPALRPAPEGSPGPDRGLDVQIYRSERGFTAILQVNGKTRQISDKSASCRSLALALAVSIAVLLDADPVPTTPPPAPPPEAEPPPAPPVSAAPPPSPVPERAPPPDEYAEPPVEEHAPALRPHFVLMAAPVITVGLLQSWAGGVTSELDVRLARFSISAGFLALPAQTLALPAGQVNLELTVGMLRACGAVADRESLRLSLCTAPYVGSLHGVTRGLPVDRGSSVPWVAAGTSAVFEQRIWGPLFWGARAELVIPFLKGAFMVDKMTAFSPAPTAGVWDAELRVSIW
jgi:hypothetical protein